MRIALEKESKFFATEEQEAKELIESIKSDTQGKVIKQNIDTKTHPDYGEYFEVIIKERFTTSKSVLETGK